MESASAAARGGVLGRLTESERSTVVTVAEKWWRMMVISDRRVMR